MSAGTVRLAVQDDLTQLAQSPPWRLMPFENHDIDSPADDKSLHEVEAVEFSQTGGHSRQIPAFRRRRPTDSGASVEGAASQQDSADRTKRGDVVGAALFEGSMNGRGTVLAEVAGFLE